MTDLEIVYKPATELARMVREREISPVDLVRNSLERIEEVNPQLNCFCFVYPEEAMAQAQAAEKELNSGAAIGPLHGIPIAIKDFTPTAGKRTTMGSRLYENWIPERNAIIVDRLLNAGAILVGKTTTPEFAVFSFTESPLWGVTRNPWNRDRTPGGSSGGSAAAVATGCVSLAEGSDMGGSVRIPASFCGIVGMKPSFGRIPFEILRTQFDSISHFGPLARTVDDAALFLSVAQGPDERDIQTLSPGIEVPIPSSRDVRGMKFALSRDLGYFFVDSDVERNLLESAEALRSLGAQVDEVELNFTPAIDEAYYKHWTVYLAVLFAHHLEASRELLDPLVVRQMEDGLAVNALDLKRVEFVRTALWQTLVNVFSTYDALLCPTTAIPAFEIGKSDFDFVGTNERDQYLGLHMCHHFNLVSQCPVLSVPSGVTRDGLPTGLQIVGRRYADLSVLRTGAALESISSWQSRRPPI